MYRRQQNKMNWVGGRYQGSIDYLRVLCLSPHPVLIWPHLNASQRDKWFPRNSRTEATQVPRRPLHLIPARKNGVRSESLSWTRRRRGEGSRVNHPTGMRRGIYFAEIYNNKSTTRELMRWCITSLLSEINRILIRESRISVHYNILGVFNGGFSVNWIYIHGW